MKFQKNFVVGLCLDESLNSYQRFFERYGEFIKTIYFNYYSDTKFCSRSKIAIQYQKKENRNLLKDVICLAKEFNILTELCLNTPNLTKNNLEDAITFITDMNIDGAVCIDEYINFLSTRLSDLIICRSFNSPLTRYTIINENFSELVVSKNFLQNIDDLKSFLEYFDLQLLINNGCIFECPGCYDIARSCDSLFNSLLSKNDLNYLFALYSFFPKELSRLIDRLEEYKDKISFKINNRTLDLVNTSLMLDAYMGQIDYISLIRKNKKYYALFCMLSHFYKDENIGKLNLDKIIEFKKNIYDIDITY